MYLCVTNGMMISSYLITVHPKLTELAMYVFREPRLEIAGVQLHLIKLHVRDAMC